MAYIFTNFDLTVIFIFCSDENIYINISATSIIWNNTLGLVMLFLNCNFFGLMFVNLIKK